jgi:hypothetical protein
MGDFKARDNNYSIFGSVNCGRFYGSAVGTIATSSTTTSTATSSSAR